MFSNARQLFFLDRSAEMPVWKKGVIEEKTPQTPKFNTSIIPYGQPQNTLLNLKVKFDDETTGFESVPSDANVHSYGNAIITDNLDAMNAEVENLKSISVGVIESVPLHEKLVRRYDEILREMNPQYAKQKAQEEQIGKLEDKMVSIEDALQNITGMLSSVLTKKKGE